MNKTLLMAGVLVGLSMDVLAGVPGVQRYNLEPKAAKANDAADDAPTASTKAKKQDVEVEVDI